MPSANPVNRYERAFAEAKIRDETLFMPYLMAGFPSQAETIDLAKALHDGGGGAMELGMPFSDPLADGPTIQVANSVALAGGAGIDHVLDSVRRLRADGFEIPITLMGYLNPLLAYGRTHGAADVADDMSSLEPFAQAAAAAGADGMIIVDLPPEESDDALAALRDHNLCLVYLLAPTSTPERIAAVAQRACGFIYLVSVTGTTGARDFLPPDLVDFVARVRSATQLPLAIGFGVSNREQVETVGRLCEAAVIGSAVITTVQEAAPADRIATLRTFAEVVTGRRREETAQ